MDIKICIAISFKIRKNFEKTRADFFLSKPQKNFDTTENPVVSVLND